MKQEEPPPMKWGWKNLANANLYFNYIGLVTIITETIEVSDLEILNIESRKIFLCENTDLV